ncbi:hypothetical protein [Fusobacterium canifelinum]|uniref:Uncharacterized protein n=1 Tax=Fusobacterium canifelinum TaxID=285729 RepID=A0ABX7CER4_9FUSO|nr:hypothetical protein [Fusobacterium canifelinum]QQS87047.1 hypothetical protein I6I83_08315 [Fusobacterium canifelinum]
MKKFIMFLFIFITTLGRANPYTPNSQQWHNYNGAMWAEQERIKAEREREAMMKQQKAKQQNNQKTIEQEYQEMVSGYHKDNPFPGEDVYSMIIIDIDSGNASWNLRFFENRTRRDSAGRTIKDSARVALKHMKDWFYRDHNIELEQRDKLRLKHFYFTLGETYAVARGVDKKTKEWNLWIMKKTNPKMSSKELEKELLEWCYKEGDNCEVLLNTTISERLK